MAPFVAHFEPRYSLRDSLRQLDTVAADVTSTCPLTSSPPPLRAGANASVGIPCNTRALGTANGYFLLTANRLTCDYGPLKYNPCNCPYCASHPFDKNCGEFCANNPGNQCCVCANIDATAVSGPSRGGNFGLCLTIG